MPARTLVPSEGFLGACRFLKYNFEKVQMMVVISVP
jgi:hypothetical protein